MDQKKVYRFTKRTAGVAAAAALTLAATGAAYAATDGDISQLLERITIYINGHEAHMTDYDVAQGGDGSYTFRIDENDENPISVTLNPENGGIASQVDYSISLDTGKLQAETGEVPFTLEAENGRLYLVEENGNRLDITETAASEAGCPYTWTDADGNAQEAIVFGTPEDHYIAAVADSVEISSGSGAEINANVAVEK